MKKKKGIILILVLLLVSIIAYVKWDDILYTYYYLMDSVFMNIGADSQYCIYIRVSEDVVFSNGKKEFVLQAWNKQPYEEMFVGYTKDTPYYGIFSNCVVSSTQYNNLYSVDIKGGSDEFSVVSEKSFDIWYNMYFSDKDDLCKSLQMNMGTWCKEFKTEIEKEYIRCFTDSSFGVNTSIIINLNYAEYGYTDIRLKNLDFEVKSFEIRKNEEGRPMVYLDMDGDGVYEKDCSEYRDEIPLGFVKDNQYPMKLTHLLPGEFENTEFNMNLGRGGGYLFKKIDDGQVQYYYDENSQWAVSETLGYGGVVLYRGLQKKFEDGKLTFLSMPYNHYAVIEEEYLDKFEVPAVLWKVSMDLYTHAELENIHDSRPTEAVFWCVMFCNEESDITYGLVMNAEYFDKKDILAVAESVKFSEDAFENPWYYCSQPSAAKKNKITVYEDKVYLIGDRDILECDPEGYFQDGPYLYGAIPDSIFTSGEKEFYILDKKGKLHSFCNFSSLEEELVVSWLLDSYNSENPFVCVNGYDIDKNRKTLLEDGRIIGIFDESVVICNMDLSDEKIIYLSGDFALSDKGNIFQIELSQENGIQKNQAKCIYNGGDIIDLEAYYGCVAVKSDGHALYFPQNAEFDNQWGEGNVSDWEDAVTVDCDRMYSVGLTSDGRVLFAGSEIEKRCGGEVEELSGWRDIVKICAVSGTVAGVDEYGRVHIVKLEP